jgi:hypothetical protein
VTKQTTSKTILRIHPFSLFQKQTCRHPLISQVAINNNYLHVNVPSKAHTAHPKETTTKATAFRHTTTSLVSTTATIIITMLR